ncbi:hypothetical protein PAMA_021856 [Pampus argenteus]
MELGADLFPGLCQVHVKDSDCSLRSERRRTGVREGKRRGRDPGMRSRAAALAASSSLPYLSGRVQLVPAAASTRSPVQPGSWSLYQHTPTTRKAESN